MLGDGGGWPANELEQVLGENLERPDAGERIVAALARAHVWVPLPAGGGPQSPSLTLPTMDIGGLPYVPVYSSESQFRICVGDHMGFTVAPAVEFARGLPPQLGIAVNPDGVVGVPLPPPAVALLCRADRTELDGPGGGRVRLWEPYWQEDPVEFLNAASAEFRALPGILVAHRCLVSVEGDEANLCVGVRFEGPDPYLRELALDALGRALGRVPAPWPVQLVDLDAVRDPMTDWLGSRVRPFHQR
ncbi:enhanced serine sensitivity protein SseB [Streptomyces sp. BI20]|uniref:enhanced serine sensitivity protein SseB n=1 Tax=Streptomyces sp. BI20 TaxID=3403460 RepID=UPI003C736231